MNICWDNIENLYMTKSGNFKSFNGKKFYWLGVCKNCKNEFLGTQKNQIYCSQKCSSSGENNGMFGKSSSGFTGRKHTTETRMKMSFAQSGEKNHFYKKTHSEETKKKVGLKTKERISDEKYLSKFKKSFIGKFDGEKNPFYGQKHSEQTKEKISNSHILSGRFIGQNNPNWRNGASKKGYCDLWFDEEYKRYIRDRDGGKCINPECNLIDPYNISLHHIDYNRKNCAIENIITLCRSCNSKANFNRRWHINWYMAILYRRYNYVY